MHAAIEKFYKYKIHRCANMEYSALRRIVIDLLKDEWLEQKESLVALKLKQVEIALYFNESCQMILNFLHDFLKEGGFEKPTPVIEKTLFSKKYMLLGKIDAIHRNKAVPLLVDFKTSKSMEMIDDYKRQLAIYALLYKDRFGEAPLTGIHFLKFKEGLKQYRISEQFLNHTKHLVLDIHKKTQSEDQADYPCVCGWCDNNFDTATQ